VTELPLKTSSALYRVWWDAISQTLALTPAALDRIGFSVRTFVASMLALYICFALQLESPQWAWLTVWIVSQGTPGVTASKSLYRVVGTVLGSIFAVVLIALFAQTPELFVLALALLVGGCTVVSSLLTNFRAYASALTAYTAGIIASDAINSPDQVFLIAMARTSCIIIGIACAVVVTSVFAPHRSAAGALDKLRIALQDTARRAAYSWRGTNEDRLKIGRKLIQELIELDTIIEYAAAESADFRIQANKARCVVSHLFSVISARRALDAHLIRQSWPKYHALEMFHEVIIDFLNETPDLLGSDKLDEVIAGLGDVRSQLDLLRPELETASSSDLVSERLVIDRLDDLLFHLDRALDQWRAILLGGYSAHPYVGLNFHRDIRAAWINGLRAFIAVIATGAFWIGSAWSSGPGALVFVCVLMSIFASQPHPDRIGWIFFKAGLGAFAMALICKYLVLATGTGFEYLTLATALFLLPLGWFLVNPSTTLPATAFTFVFLSLVQPGNPMVYDFADSLNTGVATLAGILFGTLAYILVLPPDPAAARRYVTYRIRRGLELVSIMNPVPTTSANWETRMYDRIMRLNNPDNPSATPTDEWLDAGLGALNLGNEILRLRRWLQSETMSADVRKAIIKVVDAFGRFLPDPQGALATLQEQSHSILQLDPGTGRPERRAWARATGALEEMEVYLLAHPRLTKNQSIGG
jgi:uncharacterized membrane protein YccC